MTVRGTEVVKRDKREGVENEKKCEMKGSVGRGGIGRMMS